MSVEPGEDPEAETEVAEEDIRKHKYIYIHNWLIMQSLYRRSRSYQRRRYRSRSRSFNNRRDRGRRDNRTKEM